MKVSRALAELVSFLFHERHAKKLNEEFANMVLV
jgi:hypothetical protein